MNIYKTLKLLNNETRLRIINVILDQELCVCQIEIALQLKQTNISRQLIELKESNFVKVRRDNQRIYYSINQEIIDVETLKGFIRSFDDDMLNNDTSRIEHAIEITLKTTCREI